MKKIIGLIVVLFSLGFSINAQQPSKAEKRKIIKFTKEIRSTYGKAARDYKRKKSDYKQLRSRKKKRSSKMKKRYLHSDLLAFREMSLSYGILWREMKEVMSFDREILWREPQEVFDEDHQPLTIEKYINSAQGQRYKSYMVLKKSYNEQKVLDMFISDLRTSRTFSGKKRDVLISAIRKSRPKSEIRKAICLVCIEYLEYNDAAYFSENDKVDDDHLTMLERASNLN